MRDSPDTAGDTHAASLVRRNVNLPCMAGNMIGIADAVCDTPVVTGDAFAASLHATHYSPAFSGRQYDLHR